MDWIVFNISSYLAGWAGVGAVVAPPGGGIKAAWSRDGVTLTLAVAVEESREPQLRHWYFDEYTIRRIQYDNIEYDKSCLHFDLGCLSINRSSLIFGFM